ncbi:hypothetical protein TTHERM_00469080 (macronuclear) [Tetrahymena thermophila SB210]|uniref:Uncharacterized protein n=1 Tax=Tetrahymena thermophila (strain SB210) TaxID=312017 RepID=I7MIZ2_TETTS|nr:hypothetical protein TTHERM_00469080 [Tetrahymena thermophila SB210]EAS04859.1 hypothetical protein TTHERM_00469080 [Tetrahymena thermophila SB210]|eukprot:XP_001025104.1 hypothetical protein TTHERM_00469080 [Tetrahymena thermophila SB210]
MSEGTFGLTGVDIEQKQKAQEQQQQSLPQKKTVGAILPKKNEDKKEGIESSQKSNTKFPPIEQKKPNNQTSTGQVGNQQQAAQNGQQQQQMGQTNMLMSKSIRAKSSKSLVNVRKIDNLKTFIDQERQLQSGNDKMSRNNKKSDVNMNTSYSKRLEQEREKKEKRNQFLEGYRRKIEQDFDLLYKNDNYDNVVSQLKVLENKQKLQGEIRRNEDMLNKDQKEYNQIKYEIEQRQKQLNAIKNQIENLRHVFSTEEEKQKLYDQDQLYQDYDQKYEDEQMVFMSLKHMMQTRKKLLLEEKERSEKMYAEYKGLVSLASGYEEQVLKGQQKHNTLQKKISHYSSLNAFNLNPRFQELLEDELSEFEDKNALHEIFKHEQERKDELVRLEKETKKQELEQLHLEKQKQQDKIKQEQRQMEQILNQKRKNMEELLKISCVSDISELQDRKIFLEKSNRNLKKFEEEFQEAIDNQKLEIEHLKRQLNELKYIQKESQNNKKSQQQQQQAAAPSQEEQNTQQAKQNPKGDDKTLQVIDEENLTANVNIEKFEQVLIEETDRLQDKENQVKKLERVVDEICLVFSRILYQLQPQNQKNKNIEVSRKDLTNQITICGLKLEKIISFLAKKKDSLRVESINTDADNFQPPEYVGINPLSYLRQRDVEEQREYEENQDPKFEYKEDDPNEFEAEAYLSQMRNKIHNNNFGDERDKEFSDD